MGVYDEAQAHPSLCFVLNNTANWAAGCVRAAEMVAEGRVRIADRERNHAAAKRVEKISDHLRESETGASAAVAEEVDFRTMEVEKEVYRQSRKTAILYQKQKSLND